MYKTLSAPLTSQIEIESSCPNACLHCYNAWRGQEDQRKSLSSSDVITVVEKLGSAGVARIVFTGGEPLLNKVALFAGLEAALKCGVGASVNSSLITLSSDDAEAFRTLKVKSVLTSVLGPSAAVHDTITQRKGSFEKTVAGISLLREHGINPSANIVVSRLNLEYLHDTVDFLCALGVGKITTSKAARPGNCCDFSPLQLSHNEFERYLEMIYVIENQRRIRLDNLISYPLCGMKEVQKHPGIARKRCVGGVTTLTVGTDGNTRPCSHSNRVYGNLLHEDFEGIWARMGEWRDGSLIPLLCKKCELLGHCSAGCRMEANMHSGSLAGLDPYCLPENVPYVRSQFHQMTDTTIDLPDHFRLANDVQLRQESFGAALFLGSQAKGLINEQAVQMISNWQPKVVYVTSQILTHSENADSLERFLHKLLQSGIIVPA